MQPPYRTGSLCDTLLLNSHQNCFIGKQFQLIVAEISNGKLHLFIGHAHAVNNNHFRYVNFRYFEHVSCVDTRGQVTSGFDYVGVDDSCAFGIQDQLLRRVEGKLEQRFVIILLPIGN